MTSSDPKQTPWPPTDPVPGLGDDAGNGSSLVLTSTGDGVGVSITKLDNGGAGTGAEGVLSATPDADGWFVGRLPGMSLEIGVRERSTPEDGVWWEARCGSDIRPHKYLNKVAAQQGALAEAQRMKIAGY